MNINRNMFSCRDSLMNYLIELKTGLSLKMPRNIKIPAFDRVLAFPGFAEKFASTFCSVDGIFEKTRQISMKNIRCEERHGISHFLKTDINVEGRSCLIVDDIYTTGTTLSEASRVLRLKGATSINTITLITITGDHYAYDQHRV